MNQAEQDKIDRAFHEAGLYRELKKEKFVHLKIEGPDFKVSQVVNSSKLEGTELKELLDLINNQSQIISEQQDKIDMLESHEKISYDRYLKEKEYCMSISKELDELKSRSFFERVINKK